ncbi:MAG: hypothetical protein FWC20_09660 [Oscillospiraceae bacterium]|nr:hypothetical protein [Oscillospiraceae bacterium]
MNTTEYVQYVIEERNTDVVSRDYCKTSAREVAQLLSGSFIYPLYGAAWAVFYDMETITQHLKELHENRSYFGVVYFITLLAGALDANIPLLFTQMSLNSLHIHILADAIIEDWVEYHDISEVVDI